MVSLKKRYAYKLFANLAGYGIGLITAGLIPRGLGPKAYGDFNFLSNFFQQIVGFLDMGTSTAFYTKLSQRQDDTGLFSFYSYFVAAMGLVLFLFVGLMSFPILRSHLWPGQTLLYVYLAALWAVLSWIIQLLNQVTDAYGITVQAEITKLYQKIVSVGIIVCLYFAAQINLFNFFLYQYFIMLFLGFWFVYLLVRNKCLAGIRWELGLERIKNYAREFSAYCHPLVTYSIVGLLVGVFDRWILQLYAGSIQQGFFGFSFQIGAMCFLFTNAMTPLLLREFSIAHGKGDRERMVFLFRRYVPLLYSITAYFSCFAALQAGNLIYIFGGKEFQNALPAVIIMAFYPIHQTYGQLSGSLFMATEQTRLYRDIGITFLLLGLPLTYFLIAPPGKYGFGAGAVGLAIKMVGLQFIAVNVQLYFNTKFLRISFVRYLTHQLGNIIILTGIAYCAIWMIKFLNLGKVPEFLVSGVIYTVIIGLTGYFYPRIFGLYKQDMISFISKIRGYAKI